MVVLQIEVASAFCARATVAFKHGSPHLAIRSPSLGFTDLSRFEQLINPEVIMVYSLYGVKVLASAPVLSKPCEETCPREAECEIACYTVFAQALGAAACFLVHRERGFGLAALLECSGA